MYARRTTWGLSIILFTALPAVPQRLSAADRIVAPLEGTPLKFLLGDFNRKAAEDAIGKSEPKLTEDEVEAAIRGWIIRKNDKDVDDDTVAIYKKIAETRTLPKGAELVFMTGWVTDELEFKVWWINLEIATGENRGYGLRIRERMIDCRPSEKPAADQALEPDADS